MLWMYCFGVAGCGPSGRADPGGPRGLWAPCPPEHCSGPSSSRRSRELEDLAGDSAGDPSPFSSWMRSTTARTSSLGDRLRDRPQRVARLTTTLHPGQAQGLAAAARHEGAQQGAEHHGPKQAPAPPRAGEPGGEPGPGPQPALQATAGQTVRCGSLGELGRRTATCYGRATGADPRRAAPGRPSAARGGHRLVGDRRHRDEARAMAPAPPRRTPVRPVHAPMTCSPIPSNTRRDRTPVRLERAFDVYRTGARKRQDTG